MKNAALPCRHGMRLVPVLLSALLSFGGLQAHAAAVSDSMDVTQKTNTDASSSQQKIENLSRETRVLLDEYRKIMQNAEYQDAYNEELQHLKDEQEAEIASLEDQINEIKLTQQRIVPLMRGMAETLEQFVVLDLPFHQEARVSQIIALKQYLKSSSISIPQKFRYLLEAYQIENDYGRSIESYRGPITLDQEKLSVEFLRIGRSALYYQTLDGEKSGYWSQQEKQWISLPTEYNSSIKQGMRVATGQLAPQLLTLPLRSPEVQP